MYCCGEVPEFKDALATDYAFDLACNVLSPSNNATVKQVEGPLFQNFPSEFSQKIITEMKDTINSSGPRAFAEYRKFKIIKWTQLPLFIFCIILFASLKNGDDKAIAYIALIVALVVPGPIVGIFSWKQIKHAERWRNDVAEKLKEKAYGWNMTYSGGSQWKYEVVYPYEMWGGNSLQREMYGNRKRNLLAVFVIIRASPKD